MIITSLYIRALEDCIDQDAEKMEQQCPAPKWMDTDLWKACVNLGSHGLRLQKNMARSVPEALVVTANIQGIYTDISRNNISISDIGKLNPTIKVGDLGNLMQKVSTESVSKALRYDRLKCGEVLALDWQVCDSHRIFILASLLT